MKTCMTLILATATLYLSSAAKSGADKRCDNPEPMTPFDVDKFFKDAWYITHYKFGADTGSNNDKYCTKILQKIENDNIKEVFSIDNTTTEAYSYYLSFSKKSSFDTTYGKYTAKHIQVDKVGKELEEHSITVTYLDTDYDSYSVVYVCGEIMENLFSLYAVQSRSQTLNQDVETKVKSALNGINLKLDKLSSIKDFGCKYDDSTLNALLSKSFTHETK
ncbi:nitrophorin-2-like [Rhodnius prolixus]